MAHLGFHAGPGLHATGGRLSNAGGPVVVAVHVPEFRGTHPDRMVLDTAMTCGPGLFWGIDYGLGTLSLRAWMDYRLVA